MKLTEDFFARDPETVAKDLLGRMLVRHTPARTYRGMITETGAYRGRGKRTSGAGISYAPGTIYIMTYRVANFLNIATEQEGVESCVLIRELYPMRGIERDTDGPGRLTKALEIDKSFDGLSIDGDKLWIEGEGVDERQIKAFKEEGMSPNCLGYYRMRV